MTEKIGNTYPLSTKTAIVKMGTGYALTNGRRFVKGYSSLSEALEDTKTERELFFEVPIG